MSGTYKDMNKKMRNRKSEQDRQIPPQMLSKGKRTHYDLDEVTQYCDDNLGGDD